MPFTIEEFRALVHMLGEKPEWRPDLRRLLVTDELRSLPEQETELRAYGERQFQELAVAQTRNEVVELARTKQVWQLVDGYTLAPEPLTSPS
jgi:hypothetical protein